jgi:uncharacterized RDD family membrane protein YckC
VSAAPPGLAVDSVTGIDVALAVAGPGARAYAFLVDWHIRVVLALAWYALAALLYNRRLTLALPESGGPGWLWSVLVPALSLYLLYHPVLEVSLHGHTPGKRMAGLRLVTRDGGAPSAGALLTRNVFRLIDSLPLFYGVGLTAVMLSRNHLRIGDMAAGTVLVFEHAASLPAIDVPGDGRLDASGAELVTELLARWATLAPEARARLARALLTRYGEDPGALGDDAEASWRGRLEALLHPAAGSGA